jgi:FAD synthetase
MTKVLATGVFNILHPGHLLYLKEAKKLGDELDVIVSSDKIAKKLKKGMLLPQEQRMAMVEALKPVDKAFVGDEEDPMKLLPVIRPDIIALGHDQDIDESWLKDQLAVMGMDTKVIRIKKQLEGDFKSSTEILRGLNKL